MIKFIYPTDGDMITDAALKHTDDGAMLLEICVESDKAVVVNGVHARLAPDGRWKAEAAPYVDGTLCARCAGEEASIRVHYLPHAYGKYSLSVDDNIRFLADLTLQPRHSLFDHPYLALYKRMHERFGAKVRLNLFYRMDGITFAQYGAFDLSMMTDRYRSEFIEHSDWLHLAFHSLQETPAYPYRNASYEEMQRDMQRVEREIIRFAGEQTLERATTIHFGQCTAEGVRALREGGIRELMGFMELDRLGRPSVSYGLSVERVLQTQRYGFWKDEKSDMIYGKIDVVMNAHSPRRIVEILEKQHADHPMRGFVEIMIHEQYFYADYCNYEPDYEERIEEGCRWCQEHGYSGAFAEEVIEPGTWNRIR